MPSANREPRGYIAFINRQKGFVKALLYLPILPVFLLVSVPAFLFLGGASLHAYSSMIIRARLLKLKMAEANRAISTKILRDRLATGAERGTFILESYTLGWPVARIWWTPEALGVSEVVATTLDGDAAFEAAASPPQQQIHDVYTDFKTGKALLLIAWAGKKTQAKLSTIFPGVPWISLWTGAITTKRQIDLRN